MRFSELKPGDTIFIRNGWHELFPNDSVCLILSMGPANRQHIVKYSALAIGGIVYSDFWMDSDVDCNKTYGTSLPYWDLIK